MIIFFILSISGSRYFLLNEPFSPEERFSPLITKRYGYFKITGYGSLTEKGGATVSLYSRHLYFSLTGNYLGNEVSYSEEGDSLGIVNFGSTFLSAGYISHYNNFLFSIIVKPFYEFIGEYNAFGVSSELGMVYSRGVLNAGIMVKELGMGPKYNVEKSPLPLRVEPLLLLKFKFLHPGLSVAYFINDNYISITPSFDFQIDFFTAGILYRQNLWLGDTLPSFSEVKGKIGFTPGNIGVSFIFTKENSYGFSISSEFEYRFGLEERKVIYSEEKEKASAEIFYEKALESISSNNYDEAIDYLEIALIWDPGNEKYIEKLGEIKALKKEYSYNTTIKKAKSLYNRGAYVEALVLFKKADEIKSNPETQMWIDLATKAIYKKEVAEDSIIAILRKANDYYIDKRYGEAINYWKKALSLTSDSTAVYGILDGVVNSAWEQCMDILKDVDQNINRDKIYTAYKKLKSLDRYRILINGLSNFREDYREKLQSIYDKYNELKKRINEKVSRWKIEGKSAYSNKNYTKAEEYFQKVLSIYPDDKTALSYITKIRSKLTKKDPSQLYMQGVLAYTKGDYKLAIYYWEEVLKIDPSNIKARKNIERTKSKLASIGE